MRYWLSKWRVPVLAVAAVAAALVAVIFCLVQVKSVAPPSDYRADLPAETPLPESAEADADVGPVLDVISHPLSLYEGSYRSAESYGTSVPETVPRSAITAHHLLVSGRIAQLFETIGSPDIKTVVLISPNHFGVGRSPAQVSQASWNTPYGLVAADDALVTRLADQVDRLSVEDEAQQNEHGIFELMPFVARSFPGARVVPIILYDSLPSEDIERLAEAIVREAPEATVIASIDMSHNLPSAVQEFHDDITFRDIRFGGTDTELEIDANAVLDLLQAVNRLRGDRRFVLTHHNSGLGMGVTEDWRDNTSHILGYFLPGEPERESFAALHVVGDIMLDRGVRTLIEREGADYPWGEMGRFLSGVDLRVGNLEGTVSERPSLHTYDPPYRFTFTPAAVREAARQVDAVSLSNNHSSDFSSSGELETHDWLGQIGLAHFGGYRISQSRLDRDVNGIPLTLIGYHAFVADEEELLATIRQADGEGRFVIVLPHWGREYEPRPDSRQRRLAEAMVAAGADLIVGGHPHVVQGVDLISDVPVLWSLGNFIFDQEFAPTLNALTVGVVVEANTISIHLLPVSLRGYRPEPLSDYSTAEMLNYIAEISSPELGEDLRDGLIEIPYGRDD